MPAGGGIGGDAVDEGGGGGVRGIWAGIVRRREVLLSGAARRISGTGIVGVLTVANPPNACAPLEAADAKESNYPFFVLIERGECNFVSKVQYAQDAGYAAAIVYDNEDSHELVKMSGNGFSIDIPAVFVSKEAGFVLSQFVNDKDARLYMLPALETSAWSVLAVSSISLLTLSAILSTFLFVRRQRLRRANLRLLQEPTGLSNDEIKALPIVAFNQKDVASPESCAICLEEYAFGDKLRILPCKHRFHVPCIDNWLNRRPFCPICKREAFSTSIEVSSDNAPLLSSISWQLGSTLPLLVSPGAASGRAAESSSAGESSL
ncbi:hypothetical protein KP509_15G051900 [Ceratopteris richardii]|uniref:RING-type E3 ubiquitin transferase n=1 Tax=Ceratopteris richardii TaxID=49495 RepID=A0A8T2T5J8_CERRI|nr:hypothetical protein KP509_15G051900 [Ceratopteris richardii]